MTAQELLDAALAAEGISGPTTGEIDVWSTTLAIAIGEGIDVEDALARADSALEQRRRRWGRKD